MRAGNVTYGWIAAGIWVSVIIASLVHRHIKRIVGALILLGATIGSGLASHHWNRQSLIVLGAGFATLAAVAGALAALKDRPTAKVAKVLIDQTSQPTT